MKNRTILVILGITMLIFVLTLVISNTNDKTVYTSAQTLSNKKIGWGIKRDDSHNQPDLGTTNKKLIDESNGLAIGNNENKYIYLTFDEGYEAGYTEKILDILKKNEVKAAFFITGHYLNSQPDLVKRMIDEGHIVGNHIPTSLMSFI